MVGLTGIDGARLLRHPTPRLAPPRSGDFGRDDPARERQHRLGGTARRPVLSADRLTLFFSSNRMFRSGTAAAAATSSWRRGAIALADFGTPSPARRRELRRRRICPSSLSADGNLLYLDSAVGTSRDIYVRDLTTSDPPTLDRRAQHRPRATRSAVISRDGLHDLLRVRRDRCPTPLPTRLSKADADVWVAHRGRGDWSRSRIWFRSPELNTAVRLRYPNWLSPDGCTIYLSSNRQRAADDRRTERQHLGRDSKPRPSVTERPCAERRFSS